MICLKSVRRLVVAAVALVVSDAALSQTPEWLWFQQTAGTDVRCSRKTFILQGKISQAELIATADDALEVFVNGESVLKNSRWQQPVKTDVKAKLHAGANVLAIRARND